MTLSSDLHIEDSLMSQLVHWKVTLPLTCATDGQEEADRFGVDSPRMVFHIFH